MRHHLGHVRRWKTALGLAFALALVASTFVVPGAVAADPPPSDATGPSISTDVFVYSQGDTVTVTGHGWAPEEWVDFNATDPNGVLVDMGSAQADVSGDVVYSFVLNSDATGLFTEEAWGETSGTYAYTTFDPPSAPSNLRWTDSRDAAGNLVFSWNGSGQCYYVYRGAAAPSYGGDSAADSCTVAPSNVYLLRPNANFTESTADPAQPFYAVTSVNATGANIGQSVTSNAVSLGAISVSPAGPQNLGLANAGQSGTPVNITYTNSTPSSVSVTDISMSGTQRTAFTLGGLPTFPRVTSPGGSFTFTATFTPTAAQSGTLSATMTISARESGQTGTDSKQITLSGTVNRAATCQAITVTTPEDVNGIGNANCTDPDTGETATLVYSVTTQPTHGSVAVSGSAFTYTPAGN